MNTNNNQAQMQNGNYNLATSVVTQVNKNNIPLIYSTVGTVGGAGGAGGAKAVITSSKY